MALDLTGLVHPVRNPDGSIASESRYLAIHEAGHALVAEAIDRAVKIVTINTDSGNPRVELLDMQANPQQCPIHFGGYLAIERAMGAKLKPRPMLAANRVGCDIDETGARQSASAYIKKLPDGGNISQEDYESLLFNFCAACEGFAWGLIVYHWDQLLNLAETLDNEKTMDGDRCREVLNLVKVTQ